MEQNSKIVSGVQDVLDKLQEYLAYAFKPVGLLPLIGDTGRFSINAIDIKCVTNNILKYVLHKTDKQQPPEVEFLLKAVWPSFVMIGKHPVLCTCHLRKLNAFGFF